MSSVAKDIPSTVERAASVLDRLLSQQGEDEIKPMPVVMELGPDALRLFAALSTDLKRLADHFDPPPPDVVDTPFIARRLGCTTTWIAQMVRSGEIPQGCIVPGSGKGRQWKFYRRRIEDWLASR